MKTIKKIIKNLQKEDMIDEWCKEGFWADEKEIHIPINRKIGCVELVSKRVAKNFAKKGYEAKAYSESVVIKPKKLLDNIDNCFNV